MVSQQFLVCDNSTLANFVSWASAISNFFRTAGWVNSADTGQLNGAGAGNWSGVTTVPGSAAYYYEVFEPNDGLANFYLKVEYGNFSGTNCPAVRVTVSTGTNGAGSPAGLSMGPYALPNAGFSAPSTSTTYECDFSGAAGRMCFLLWRNTGSTSVTSTTNPPQLFCIERSINASGAYTGSHVTIVVGGSSGSGSNDPTLFQQSLVFGIGVAPISTNRSSSSPDGLTLLARIYNSQTGSASYNGSIPFDTIAPGVGLFDYPLTCCGVACAGDISEGVPFSVIIYGATRTYIPTKLAPLGVNQWGTWNFALCMRYD